MDFFKRHAIWIFAFILALFIVGSYSFLIAPPANFPSGSRISIEKGALISIIVRELYDAHIIAHPLLLQVVLRMSGASSRVQAGEYLFSSPENVFFVAHRLTIGAFGLPPIRITFPEGITVFDMGEKIAEAFPSIPSQDFLSTGKIYEGYLFPDTYHFPSDADITSIIQTMRENFNTKTASLMDDIESSGHSLSDVVIMASLLEKEVRTDANRRIVAGILWNRLGRGMPLQVDAVFGYIFSRDTYSPSFADLKVDSLYNTYTHTGLPPGPINNPGLKSIEAVLHPTQTDYLYYLTGKDNLMHYATTYAGHQANRKKYLY